MHIKKTYWRESLLSRGEIDMGWEWKRSQMRRHALTHHLKSVIIILVELNIIEQLNL